MAPSQSAKKLKCLNSRSKYFVLQTLVGLNLFLKLIYNSLSLKKEIHERDGVWISDVNLQNFLRFY